jgi:hypothetical protein
MVVNDIIRGFFTNVVNNKQTRCYGMVIVGYDKSSEGVPYWILKKGIDGYMYFVRGSDKGLYGINIGMFHLNSLFSFISIRDLVGP